MVHDENLLNTKISCNRQCYELLSIKMGEFTKLISFAKQWRHLCHRTVYVCSQLFIRCVLVNLCMREHLECIMLCLETDAVPGQN